MKTLLSVKKTRKLIWFTWLEFIVVGLFVYFFTNPIVVLLVLAGPIAIHALVNFWIQVRHVPVKWSLGVPAVFMPTAFFTGIGTLATVIDTHKFTNSSTLAFATVCLLCVMVLYPESKYADYDWNIFTTNEKSVALLCGGFLLKTFYAYNSS